MEKFKRSKNDELRTKCSECGTQGVPTNAMSKTVECPKCRNAWDGIADEAEKEVRKSL